MAIFSHMYYNPLNPFMHAQSSGLSSMIGPIHRILVISDIEGSSGCWSRSASSFLTGSWARACIHMSQDIDVVVRALFDAGVRQVRVKDFHRTGYNLLPELIDPRATIISGYRPGPVPGIGEPGGAQALMLLGMHAASGTEGFLAHTLTSRIASLEVNGRLMAEAELFSASLSPYGIRPIFFSGCPVSCRQAEAAIDGVHTYPIDKSVDPGSFDAPAWRAGLGAAAAWSLHHSRTRPYLPLGPFRATLTLRDGPAAARKIADRWGFDRKGACIFLEAGTIHILYQQLIRLCYLNPFIEKTLPVSLKTYHLFARFGQEWVRRTTLRRHFLQQGP
jgi:D-amino peptidase